MPTRKNGSFIKTTLRILLGVILSLFLIVLLIYILLWLPPVQQKIKDFALREVAQLTGSEIGVGKLSFRPFNSIHLEDIYASDQKNDTLLYVHSLKAEFDLFRLLNSRLLIHSIELDDVRANISKEHPDSLFNFQFLIDAFASPDTTKQDEPSTLLIEISTVSLKNGQINYDILSELPLEDGYFDYNHLAIERLEVDANLSSIDLNNLDVSLNHISLKEEKGFVLSDLKAKLRSDSSILHLNDFLLQLPNSELKGDVELNYSGMELSDILSGASYALTISSDKFASNDVRTFYPGIEMLSDQFTLSGKMEGRFPQINLNTLKLNYGQDLDLQLQAELEDMNRWKTSDFSLRLDRFYVTNSFVAQIMNLTSENESASSIPVDLEDLTAEAVFAGSLSDFSIQLNAQTDNGSCDLTGRAGMAESGAIHFDANLSTPGFDLGKLMTDTVFGVADLRLDAKGRVSESGVINASASIQINRFDFNSYTYRDVTADGFYVGDSVQVEIKSEDPNIPFELRAHANLGKQNASADLFAQFREIHFDSLNFLPDYPESEISMIIRANVKGFDPERMEAGIYIDSLYAQTQTGYFEDNGIRALYSAGEGSKKELTVSSKLVNVKSRGQFSFAGVEQAVKQAFPVFFPEKVFPGAMSSGAISSEENFDLLLQVRKSNAITPLLGIQQEIPDSALLIVRYKQADEKLKLDGTAFCIFNETDTIKLDLDLSNIGNNLDVLLQVDNKSQQYNINGGLNAEVEFIPVKGAKAPDMKVNFKPTAIVFNDTRFAVSSSDLFISDNYYEIRDFALQHSPTEYLKIDGVVSEEMGDSLLLIVNDFQIGTILKAMKTTIPLSGIASGEIQASRILNTPIVRTRNFAVDSIRFADNLIGNLNLSSGWSSNRQGLALRATLTNGDTPESFVQGFYSLAKDSLMLSGSLKEMKLAWLKDFMQETLYGLDGSAGANFKITGSLSKPKVNGAIYLNEARLGVKMLNTLYNVSDSVLIQPDGLNFRRFTIRDEDGKAAVINGRINRWLSPDINPNLRISLDNFRVLNNKMHTDSLFFGDLQLSGNLSIRLQNKDWVLGGSLSHGKHNAVTVNMPSSPAEAQRYSSLTFVNSRWEPLDSPEGGTTTAMSGFTLPLKVSNLLFAVNPELTLGVVYNPSTKDKATVSGTGNITFSMDMKNSDMNLLGSYLVEDGSLTLSLANITRKKFTMQENSKLIFNGDPLKTSFDITAVYALRADLLTLDSSFGDMGLSNTKVNVQCLLTISGNLDDMKLKYEISLPNQSDDVQRKLEGLLYTDDLKIKQLAYLLAFGSFMPPGDNITAGNTGNIWTSLASSSITGQLNNLLSGVLSENWSIGTDIHTNDANFSQVDMDVNVSTQLFNNRLTINTSFGYNNDVTQRDNFTGDFDFEYKLTPSGNLLLKFYNVTNNKYSDKARMTQGIGLIYRRQGKFFRQLFFKDSIPRFDWQRERAKPKNENASETSKKETDQNKANED